MSAPGSAKAAPSSPARPRRWFATASGLTALVLVQVAFVGVALWPVLFGGDTFVRHETVTMAGKVSGYQTRWIILRENGEFLRMPPPDALVFEKDKPLCVALFEGAYGSQKARLADADACTGDEAMSPVAPAIQS